MGALRTFMASFVAEGGEIETTTGWNEIIPTPRDAPPEMHQYYGPAGAPMFGPPGTHPSPAPPPGRRDWAFLRKTLPPWVAVTEIHPDVVLPNGAGPSGA
jgi:hypothetical protein